MAKTFDLRSLVPNLPKTLTEESLNSMPAADLAALIQNLDKGISTLGVEVGRADAAVTHGTSDVERIRREAEEACGVSTTEELTAVIQEKTALSVARWDEVAALLDAQAA